VHVVIGRVTLKAILRLSVLVPDRKVGSVLNQLSGLGLLVIPQAIKAGFIKKAHKKKPFESYHSIDECTSTDVLGIHEGIFILGMLVLLHSLLMTHKDYQKAYETSIEITGATMAQIRFLQGATIGDLMQVANQALAREHVYQSIRQQTYFKLERSTSQLSPGYVLEQGQVLVAVHLDSIPTLEQEGIQSCWFIAYISLSSCYVWSDIRRIPSNEHYAFCGCKNRVICGIDVLSEYSM
jgi:hypothetical protein